MLGGCALSFDLSGKRIDPLFVHGKQDNKSYRKKDGEDKDAVSHTACERIDQSKKEGAGHNGNFGKYIIKAEKGSQVFRSILKQFCIS